MVIAPTYNSVHRSLKVSPFVDRDEYIKTFQDILATSEQKEYNVLYYYGISGIGKSKLQQELQNMLTDDYEDVIWAKVDFKDKPHREIGTFLFSLRDQLSGKYKVKFNHFNIAHALYWKKIHPEIPLDRENYNPIEKGGIVDTMLEILNLFGPFSFVGDVHNVLSHATEKFARWWAEDGLKFANRLNEADPNEIEQLLPVFFFTDLNAYLKNKSKKPVILIDTYEALWEEARDRGNFNSKDGWIRDIIANFETVFWVICGRDELRWNEVDNDWNNYLYQHEIGVLPKEYCIEFLDSYNIDDEEIKSIIVEASEGYPYYLALSVDTYLTIKEKGKEPVPEDFAKTRHEIFNGFFRYLDKDERSTLLILSDANFWDHNLFNLLIDEFGTNYPKSEMAFDELHRFSFMKENSDGTWSMHSLMRKSLQENQKTEEKQKVHKYLFSYYDQQLDDIDVKEIKEKHKTAFNEAFYHGIQFMEVGVLSSWFYEISEIFHTAGLWEFLIPLSNCMHNILEIAVGSEHPDVAIALNNLTVFYISMGKYEKATPLAKRALEINEKSLGSEHPAVATSLNNLASLYESIGNYEKAIPLSERALAIDEKTLGKNHFDVASSLNKLASLYRAMGNYGEALPLCERALAICAKTLGSEHPEVGACLNNLALLYQSMEKYEEALKFYKLALAITEKKFGFEHYNVAISLNNLASLYESMEKYGEALPLYERALAISEKKLSSRHPDIAMNFNNQASLYISMGRYEEALSRYEHALGIYEQTFGSEHPNVAIVLNNLASLYDSMGNYEEALSRYELALSILEKTLGIEHPNYIIIKDNLTSLLNEREQ